LIRILQGVISCADCMICRD